MTAPDRRSDDELLAEQRPGRAGAAFAAFYARHEPGVLAYFRHRVPGNDTAADLTAETFAQALASRRTYRPQPGGSAIGWLFGIASHVLGRSVRRGRVESRARRRLGVGEITLDAEQEQALERLSEDSGLLAALQGLPPDQREAVRARVLDERDYREIAARLRVSQPVARKRVSRGLAALRRRVEEPS